MPTKTATESRAKPNFNGFKKLMVAAAGTLITLAVGSLWYQLGGYARADDLKSAKAEYKELAAEAKQEREAAAGERQVIRDNIAKINQSIGSIDTALRILLPEYRGTRRGPPSK